MSSWIKRLSILPILFFPLALAILFIFNLGEDLIFNPPYLLLILNTIFLTGTSIAIAIVSVKSFLKEGSNVMLILGLATTAGGLAALLAGWVAMFSVNYSVAIYNIGILLSGGLQVLSATIMFAEANPTESPNRKKTLVISYLATIISLTAVTSLIVLGFSPTFFTSSGSTLERQWVIGTAIAFFIISSVLFGLKYSQSKSRVLYWYTMALAMFALGLFAATIFGTPNAVFNWTARIILYVAGFYFLAGLLSAMKAEGFEGSETVGISERWAEAFRSDRQQFDTLFSKLLNGFSYHRIIVNDRGEPVDYVFLAANEAFERMTGLKLREIVGRKVSEVLPGIDKDPADWIGTYGKVALTGQPVTFENYSAYLKKWYSVSAYSPKKDYFVAIFEDITERKKAEQELESYRKRLEKQVEERTQQLKDAERLATIGATAGMVGHDIRNPLQAITSDVFIAKTELESTPESEEKKNALESLQEIEKNIDYINKIVQDLQDYARPLNPNPGQADLKHIIDKLVQKKDLPKNVKLSVKVEDEARKFVADADYLTRILYNLVTNAVQAMPKGGKLTILAYKEAKDIVLKVEDTGVGIPEAIRSKMFTAMFTTKSKGQGFGLPVVKRMTESLGGTVTFESQEGKGTTFTVRLPPQELNGK